MSVAPEAVETRLRQVLDRIEAAARSCDRDPESVKIVAASKTVPVDHIRTAIEAGVTILGENYVQEARDKIQSIGQDEISWHFIGHLQTNKAKYAVKLFNLIHSVDSFKLAQELDKRARAAAKIQQILIQVNISGEETKSGVDEEHTLNLVRQISSLDGVAVRGLMTMPPYFDAPERVRPYFRALRNLQARIIEEDIPNIDVQELSMGMTGDFEAAIEEGATLVRIGTAIFGERV